MPIHDEGDGLVLCEQHKVMTALILIGSDLVFLELTQSFIVDFLCNLIDMCLMHRSLSNQHRDVHNPVDSILDDFLYEMSFS
jgi:hypothetical protein